ncbi:hypothetical protein [Luteipulveratus halotolerans]|uniref:Uncharacterized protein n=1 Tax=Luteipulveratus halotolerans TaxID=1631356 RepID=A0A0L6CLS0_9MICO|nr:hypothetical protein [Luteipulveratus halotolerans]KNX38746.1 hypothetical protein VV01_18945 [Luteipulveratus halotolerans]
MIELSVEGAGLGRARFVTDPLWETVASLAALNLPTGRVVHRRLAELREQVAPDDLRLLTDVCGDHEWLPDFVTPQPDPRAGGDPADQFRRIVDIADMDVAAADLADLGGRRTDSVTVSMGAGEAGEGGAAERGHEYPFRGAVRLSPAPRFGDTRTL